MQPLLQLTDAQIGGWVASFILPLFRVAAMLMTMPIFGTQVLPQRVRLYVAVAITVVIVPGLPPAPTVDAISVQALLLVAEQIIIGALFGFSGGWLLPFALLWVVTAAHTMIGFAVRHPRFVLEPR